MADKIHVLSLSCDDHSRIVAGVTTDLAVMGTNIAKRNQFWERRTSRFFMQIAVAAPTGALKDDIEGALRSPIERFGMKATPVDQGRRLKIVIMVSKFDHALLHIFSQIKVGWLNAEVVASTRRPNA